MQEAARLVAVDDPDCLQEAVEDGGADKAHAAPVKIAGQPVGEGVGRPVVLDEDGAAGEQAQVSVKGAELIADLPEHAGVADGGVRPLICVG